MSIWILLPHIYCGVTKLSLFLTTLFLVPLIEVPVDAGVPLVKKLVKNVGNCRKMSEELKIKQKQAARMLVAGYDTKAITSHLEICAETLYRWKETTGIRTPDR